jgi:hypothetical protein
VWNEIRNRTVKSRSPESRKTVTRINIVEMVRTGKIKISYLYGTSESSGKTRTFDGRAVRSVKSRMFPRSALVTRTLTRVR